MKPWTKPLSGRIGKSIKRCSQRGSMVGGLTRAIGSICPAAWRAHRMYYQGPLSDKPNVRPWNLQRNGYAGISQYGGWVWSGDVQSTWKTLSNHVPIGQNYSLSVSPFWGSDIGGFSPSPANELTGELYTRWFQFAAFCPSFRSHGRTWKLHSPLGWNTGETGPVESRPLPPEAELHNAEVEPICRDYLNLRYQLMPYTYTVTREAHDTGLPLMRALWLHYPTDATAVDRGDEFLWGRDLLVAPVVEKGAKSREVYLPAGDWYDWWTNEKQSGAAENLEGCRFEDYAAVCSAPAQSFRSIPCGSISRSRSPSQRPSASTVAPTASL